MLRDIYRGADLVVACTTRNKAIDVCQSVLSRPESFCELFNALNHDNNPRHPSLLNYLICRVFNTGTCNYNVYWQCRDEDSTRCADASLAKVKPTTW